MSRKWQLVLKDVDKLIGSSNGSLFDRSKLLVAVWSDGDYLAHHKGDVDAAEVMLNEKLGDYGLTIFDVKTMLAEFPKREQWETGKLRAMLAEALAAEDSRRETRESPKVERKGPVPRKEFEQLQKIVENSESRIESISAENARLREENSQLRMKLEHANGRINELERVLRRELQPA